MTEEERSRQFTLSSSFNLPAIASWERGWYTVAPIPSPDDEIPAVPRIPVSHKRLLVAERGFQSPVFHFPLLPVLFHRLLSSRASANAWYSRYSLQTPWNVIDTALGIDYVTTRFVVSHAMSSLRDFPSKSLGLVPFFVFFSFTKNYIFTRERERYMYIYFCDRVLSSFFSTVNNERDASPLKQTTRQVNGLLRVRIKLDEDPVRGWCVPFIPGDGSGSEQPPSAREWIGGCKCIRVHRSQVKRRASSFLLGHALFRSAFNDAMFPRSAFHQRPASIFLSSLQASSKPAPFPIRSFHAVVFELFFFFFFFREVGSFHWEFLALWRHCIVDFAFWHLNVADGPDPSSCWCSSFNVFSGFTVKSICLDRCSSQLKFLSVGHSFPTYWSVVYSRSQSRIKFARDYFIKIFVACRKCRTLTLKLSS